MEGKEIGENRVERAERRNKEMVEFKGKNKQEMEEKRRRIL